MFTSVFVTVLRTSSPGLSNAVPNGEFSAGYRTLSYNHWPSGLVADPGGVTALPRRVTASPNIVPVTPVIATPAPSAPPVVMSRLTTTAPDGVSDPVKRNVEALAAGASEITAIATAAAERTVNFFIMYSPLSRTCPLTSRQSSIAVYDRTNPKREGEVNTPLTFLTELAHFCEIWRQALETINV